MLQRRSFPRAPSQQQVLGIHAKQILIINIAPNVTRSSCLTRQGNLLFLFIYFFYTYPHAFRVINDMVMCQSKVSSKADTNIPPHTDGEDPIANKNSRAPRIEKKLLDNNQWLARAHVFNLQEILPVTHLHCFLCFFFLWFRDLTFQTLRGGFNSLCWRGRHRHTGGHRDSLAKSNYCCVVKTRAVATGGFARPVVTLASSASPGRRQFFYHSAGRLQMAAALPGKVRRPSVWMIKSFTRVLIQGVTCPSDASMRLLNIHTADVLSS